MVWNPTIHTRGHRNPYVTSLAHFPPAISLPQRNQNVCKKSWTLCSSLPTKFTQFIHPRLIQLIQSGQGCEKRNWIPLADLITSCLNVWWLQKFPHGATYRSATHTPFCLTWFWARCVTGVFFPMCLHILWLTKQLLSAVLQTNSLSLTSQHLWDLDWKPSHETITLRKCTTCRLPFSKS